MQRSVLLRVVRASSFCCLTIKKLRERRGLGNLRHFKDQPTEKSGIVYDNLFLSSQACVTNKLSTHAAFVREALETVRQFFGCKLEFDILMLDGREVRFGDGAGVRSYTCLFVFFLKPPLKFQRLSQ